MLRILTEPFTEAPFPFQRLPPCRGLLTLKLLPGVTMSLEWLAEGRQLSHNRAGG